jgi:hypothetical protein
MTQTQKDQRRKSQAEPMPNLIGYLPKWAFDRLTGDIDSASEPLTWGLYTHVYKTAVDHAIAIYDAPTDARLAPDQGEITLPPLPECDAYCGDCNQGEPMWTEEQMIAYAEMAVQQDRKRLHAMLGATPVQKLVELDSNMRNVLHGALRRSGKVIAPPARNHWVGLTDTEVSILSAALGFDPYVMVVIREAEAKLKEKNAAPPARKPWVWLTKEDVESWDLPVDPTVFEFVQFIEAKLKEKNT